MFYTMGHKAMSKKKEAEDYKFLRGTTEQKIADLIALILFLAVCIGGFLYLIVWPIVSLLGFFSGGFFLGVLRSFKGIF